MAESESLINRSGSANQNEASGFTGHYDKIWRPILAEMVGVTLFVFVGVCSLVSGNITSAALGHGLLIALLISCFGELSGGHFNPAVTVAVALCGGLPFFLVPGYIVGQVVGAVLGAALVRGTFPEKLYISIAGGCHELGHINLGTVDTPELVDVQPGWGILIELMITSVLIITVLMTAVNPRTKSSLAPLAIGFAVTVGIMGGGMLTGASMNPARAIGPAIVASGVFDDAWRYHYIYWLGPILGSILASLLYRFLFASQSTRWVARRDSVYERISS
ncbi:cellular response to water deprivation [Mactra antiquata]